MHRCPFDSAPSRAKDSNLVTVDTHRLHVTHETVPLIRTASIYSRVFAPASVSLVESDHLREAIVRNFRAISFSHILTFETCDVGRRTRASFQTASQTLVLCNSPAIQPRLHPLQTGITVICCYRPSALGQLPEHI